MTIDEPDPARGPDEADPVDEVDQVDDVDDVDSVDEDFVASPGDSEPKPKKKKNKKKKVVVREVIPAWVKWAGAVGVVVLVAALAFGVAQKRQADDLHHDEADRKAAAQVAGEFTQTLFTYDSANPTASLDRLKELATTGYQPKVDSARSAALTTPSADAQGVSMSASVSEVHLGDIDGDNVQAVTQSIWTLNAKGQSLPLELYLRVDLQKVDGTWKVADVTALTARQPGGASATTPSTTAPPTSAPGSSAPPPSSGG